MNRRLETVKNLLAEILNYSFWFVAGNVVLEDFAGIHSGKAVLWEAGLIALFFYTVREKSRKLPIFLLLHLLPGAAFWMAYQGNIIQKIWVMLVIIFLTGCSFGKRLHSDDPGMNVVFPPVYGAFMWLLYLVDKGQGGGKCTGLILYTVIGYMAGYFCYYFLRQFLHYMDMNNRTTENIPFDRVFFSSALLAGGFTTIAMVIMIFGADNKLAERIGQAFQRMVVGTITFLLSLIPRSVEEEMILSPYQGGGGSMPWDHVAPAEPSLFMKILEILLGIFAVGAITALTLMAVAGVIRFIRSNFARRRTVREILRGSHVDLVEKVGKQDTANGSKKKTSLWNRAQRAMTPEERIRRIYRKAVERKQAVLGEKGSRELTKASTPRERCVQLFSEKEGKALEFAGLYEKARYGSGLCDGSDVKRARKLEEEFHRQSAESI